jgi:hypothetical protein
MGVNKKQEVKAGMWFKLIDTPFPVSPKGGSFSLQIATLPPWGKGWGKGVNLKRNPHPGLLFFIMIPPAFFSLSRYPHPGLPPREGVKIIRF